MYKVKIGKARALYFNSYDSACDFCIMAGLRIKIVKINNQ